MNVSIIKTTKGNFYTVLLLTKGMSKRFGLTFVSATARSTNSKTTDYLIVHDQIVIKN